MKNKNVFMQIKTLNAKVTEEIVKKNAIKIFNQNSLKNNLTRCKNVCKECAFSFQKHEKFTISNQSNGFFPLILSF